MSVVKTQSWLYEFVKACKDQPLERPYFIQCDVLCDPLKGSFSSISTEELHYLLLTYGLFEPEEWSYIETVIRKMEKRKTWELVEEEYNRLKKEWNGPEIPIFIFPIKHAHLPSNKLIIKKNGVAFKEALFLFLSSDLLREEIMAVLAHEYSHICRLAYVNTDEKNITLKDSLIMEGLGEFAVKELYGEKWLAPWTDLYTYKDVVELWKSRFIPALHVRGKEKQHLFLYGNEDRQFPKWIGYHIGYQIVESFHSLRGPFTIAELYSKSSEELILGSKFPYK